MADRPGFGLGTIGLTCGFDSAFAGKLCLRLGEPYPSAPDVFSGFGRGHAGIEATFAGTRQCH
jgi:hypothetical protein